MSDTVASKSYPLVSIRTPSFNHQKFIKQALDSAVNDRYPNKELVIIDDASTDGSDAVIRLWIEQNGHHFPVRYKRHPRNLGIARTLNDLGEECRGDYIVSLASDDYLLPDGILQRFRYLREHPEKLAVFGDCLVVDGENRTIADSGLSNFYRSNLQAFRTEAGLRKQIINKWSVPGPVLMVDRRLFARIGTYNQDLPVEDWDFYLRMAAENLVGFLDWKVAAYRVHGNNYCMRPEARIKLLKGMRETLFLNRKRFSPLEQCYIARKIIEISVAIQVSRCRR